MKILIIGGTAFTGPHLVNALAAAGHAVTVYHRGLHDAPRPAGVRRLSADLSSLKTYAPALRAQAFDVVVHMIAMSAFDAQSAVHAFAGHAGRIVVASSQDVYAAFAGLLRKQDVPPSAAPITEESPLRTARNLHGGDYEKLDVEETFLAAADRLPVTLLRMPATYGPEDPRHRFFPYVKRFADGRPAILLEPAFGTFRWSHAYVENVAHAFTLAVTNPAAANRTFNVSEPKTPTTGERLHALARAAGYRGQIVVVPRDRCPPHLLKPHDFRHDLVTSDAALRRDLGFAEPVSPEEALRRTVVWQQTVCPAEITPADFDYPAEDAFLRAAGIL
jgi:nucleoside-diphosphate-sugar epimerase